MKKVLLSVALFSFILVSTAFAGPQDFILVNESASNICYVYVSAANSGNWEEDVLGKNDCLPPGANVRINFSGSSQPVWDLRVADEQGNYEEYYGFDLNAISQINIKGGGEAAYQ